MAREDGSAVMFRGLMVVYKYKINWRMDFHSCLLLKLVTMNIHNVVSRTTL
jgi:hypothetical protein